MSESAAGNPIGSIGDGFSGLNLYVKPGLSALLSYLPQAASVDNGTSELQNA